MVTKKPAEIAPDIFACIGNAIIAVFEIVFGVIECIFVSE